MKTIRFGGQLEKGDFIVVGYQNSLEFGWYIGDGINTVQFYAWRTPHIYHNTYEGFLKKATPNNWEVQRYAKGFTLKTINKDFVKFHDWRICKVNPEEIFTNPSDIEVYEKSRDVLIKLNFIK